MAESAGAMRNFQPAAPSSRPVLSKGLRHVPKLKRTEAQGMTNEELTRRALAVVAGRRQKALTLAQDVMRAARCAIPQLAGLEQKQMEAGLAAARALPARRRKKQAALARCAALEAQRDELCAPRAFAQSRNSHARFAATQAAAATLCTCVQQLVRRCARQS